MSTSTWPEPVLLPGQAAAPAGPCDLLGMYVMHHAFRRDLARFAGAVRRTDPADVDTWRLLAARWERFGRYLHEHHAKEDEALWPALLAAVDAAGDDEARVVLEEMEAEHAAIDPALGAVERALAAQDPVRAGEAVDLASLVLDQHLAHEERDAIAIIQRHLDADAWAHLERTRLAQKPKPAELLFFLPWAADGLPDDVLARLLAGGGPPIRWLLALGRRRYLRSEARLFG
jgi:hypothetical protein